MDVTHSDRRGNAWVFPINCTPYQAGILVNLLRAVRNMGNREALTLKYYDNFDDNEAFCDYVEDVLLSALRDAPPREPLPQEPGPTIAELLADDSPASMPAPVLTTSTPQPEVVGDSVDSDDSDDDEEPQYYWQKF